MLLVEAKINTFLTMKLCALLVKFKIHLLLRVRHCFRGTRSCTIDSIQRSNTSALL